MTLLQFSSEEVSSQNQVKASVQRRIRQSIAEENLANYVLSQTLEGRIEVEIIGDGHRSRSGGSGWTRNMSKVRSLFGNMIGGLRGGSNVVLWEVAASLSYFLRVRPSQDLKRK